MRAFPRRLVRVVADVDRDAHPGAVDDDVDRTELAPNRSDTVDDRRGIGHVADVT